MCYYTIKAKGGKWAVGLLLRHGIFFVRCSFDSKEEAEAAADKLNNFVAV